MVARNVLGSNSRFFLFTAVAELINPIVVLKPERLSQIVTSLQSEPFCSVFPGEMSESTDASKSHGPVKPGGPRALPRQVWCRQSWRTEMLREDLMKPDLFSEVVLLGSAALIVVALLLIVVAAFTQPAALA